MTTCSYAFMRLASIAVCGISMTGLPYLMRIMGSGLRKPKVRVRGKDVAGRVEAVGKDVTRFQPGDGVFGTCDGSFAEYACGREDKFVPIQSIGADHAIDYTREDFADGRQHYDVILDTAGDRLVESDNVCIGRDQVERERVGENCEAMQRGSWRTETATAAASRRTAGRGRCR